MKKINIKAAFVIASIALMISLLTGCGGKTPVSTADFENVANQKGYVVQDGTDYFADYDYIKLATLAAPENKSFQIEFYELNDEAVAKSFFDSNKSNFAMMRVDDCVEVADSGKNYDVYKLEMYDKFMMVERVGKTVVYVHTTDASNKEAIESFLTEIKY